MPKLLVIESSPRGDASVSRNMTRRFVDAWRAAHPDGDVVVRDLMKTDLTFVTAPWLQAYFTPPDLHTTEMKGALALSDELVAELLDADEIAIGTPVYNYNVPALLKAWIDHIVRKGLTLGHDGKGLVTGTSASILLASGGVYTEGSPIAARDIATQYLRLLLNVIGIEDITFVAGGGAKAVDLGETTMDAFVSSIEGKIKAAAA
jgi:FMN-dependent NADH-azoreductase